jgi:hypothetical protein
MKEYKAMIPKLGIRNRVQNLEDLLNQMAREGWQYKEITASGVLILERDKNR